METHHKTNMAFALVDWGTTSFRLWLVDREGQVINKDSAPLGMMSLKPSEYEEVLEGRLSAFGMPDDLPVLICGMAGAAQGWQEVGYVDTPTQTSKLLKNLMKVKTVAGRDVRIIPGIAQRCDQNPDVMRGEETILFGARECGCDYSVFCMPGTHCKWVFTKGDKLTRFTTFMTGEMFALLSQKSTLAPFMKNDFDFAFQSAEFEQAFRNALEEPNKVVGRIFSLRAGPLLNQNNNPSFLKSRLSGMLIGLEVASVRDAIDGEVCLIADGVQSQAYSLALSVAGIKHETFDAKDLALAGLTKFAQEIWKSDAR